MQEDHLIPENLRKAFEKAKQSANIMPKSQLDAALVKELGPDWMRILKHLTSGQSQLGLLGKSIERPS
jgi:hypothetical protein